MAEQARRYWMGAPHMTLDESIIVANNVSEVLSEFEPDDYYTSDNPQLCKFDSHYLFAFDNLKEGFEFSENLEQGDIVGVGYTTTPWWTLWHNKKSVVAIVDNKPEANPGYLYGELYKVPTETIRCLDFEFSNSCYYKRLRIPIKTYFPHDKPQVIHAFMYAGVKSYWTDKLSRMHKCDLLTSNKNKSFRYYNYLKKYEHEQ